MKNLNTKDNNMDDSKSTLHNYGKNNTDRINYKKDDIAIDVKVKTELIKNNPNNNDGYVKIFDSNIEGSKVINENDNVFQETQNNLNTNEKQKEVVVNEDTNNNSSSKNIEEITKKYSSLRKIFIVLVIVISLLVISVGTVSYFLRREIVLRKDFDYNQTVSFQASDGQLNEVGVHLNSFLAEVKVEMNNIENSEQYKDIFARLDLDKDGKLDFQNEETDKLYKDYTKKLDDVYDKYFNEEILSSFKANMTQYIELQEISSDMQNFGSRTTAELLTRKAQIQTQNRRNLYYEYINEEGWIVQDLTKETYWRCKGKISTGCEYCDEAWWWGAGKCPQLICPISTFIPLCLCDIGIGCHPEYFCWNGFEPGEPGICVWKRNGSWWNRFK